MSQPNFQACRWLIAILLVVVISGCVTPPGKPSASTPAAAQVATTLVLSGQGGQVKIDANSYRTTVAINSRVRFLVLHYTTQNFKESIRLLTVGPGSAHYLLPRFDDPTYPAAGFNDLRVFSLLPETERAWHAGVSHWQDRDNLNDTSLGIEIVNEASEMNGVFVFPGFEMKQLDVLAALIRSILPRYPDMAPRNVVGHSDIAYMRKSDPGPMFPWKRLSQQGIGAWYDDATRDKYIQQFNRTGLPAQAQIRQTFVKYGYQAPLTDTEYLMLIRAFQMHFRPERYDGQMDVETCAILYALNEKYVSS